MKKNFSIIEIVQKGKDVCETMTRIDGVTHLVRIVQNNNKYYCVIPLCNGYRYILHAHTLNGAKTALNEYKRKERYGDLCWV